MKIKGTPNTARIRQHTLQNNLTVTINNRTMEASVNVTQLDESLEQGLNDY